MKQYIIRRLFVSIIVLFGVSIMLYLLGRLTPGDYVANITAGNPNITKEMQDRMREVYGLDKGIVEGYLSWLWDAIRGDFGTSFLYQKPVTEIIMRYIPITFSLAFSAMIFEILLAIPFGIIAARKQYSRTDYIIVAIAIIGISLPSFFFAAILKRVFAVGLGVLPLSGMVNARAGYTGWARIADIAKHLVLPVTVFVVTGVGSLLRYVRTNMLEVLSADYVRTARAKGVPEYKVIGKHAFRNTLIPIVTMLGIMIPGLFSGAVITEGIFSLEGLGNIAIKAVQSGDIPYLMGFNMFIAILTIIGTLISDILYAVVDPRVRYS
ncbi:ABC transporter permease subunit [Anaerocolumna sedimenticola]|uniref:ABC transporter permease subunit n=1 Tax=Anaerocolumna sedimenticola TaxID=2696063 RepID=A0A6P1TPA0_9FIRM|nr:ABC transporter permease [Anaerocolumna sedimenticola]QHQ62814.1 ABC transporter permease subunit [Anaerocolumna sedimenticola]